MNQAWFRFHEVLNDFLPASLKQEEFPHSFEGSPSIKDTIEAIGVPHAEVDQIMVNGDPVDFSYRMRNDDHVSVYPVFPNADDVPGVQHLQKKHFEPRFILDVHLGKLAKYMRMLGFDALYETGYEDNEIIRISVEEERIILTRDKLLLRNNKIIYGLWVRSINPLKQISEIIQRLSLKKEVRPFTRCLECNGILSDVSKEKIRDKLPEKTNLYYEKFQVCERCGRIYWEGSHFERMKKLIADLI
jgi:uncharacterized protein with PIN domain